MPLTYGAAPRRLARPLSEASDAVGAGRGEGFANARGIGGREACSGQVRIVGRGRMVGRAVAGSAASMSVFIALS